jgi:ParB-like chromosome segregation protein Spo0J
MSQAPMRIAVDLIRFDQQVWPRHQLDKSRVSEFMDLFEHEGDEALPPLEIVSDGSGSFLLAEGVHRYAALRSLGRESALTVTVDVPAGLTPVQAAFERAVDTAARSSKPLTRAERNAAVVRLLAEHPDRSDREIASLCGVSHQTVGRRRAELDNDEEETVEPVYQQRLHEEEIAKRLFKALEKVWEARGFGLVDSFKGDRTGERLARVLHKAYGEEALERAHRYQAWIDQAVKALSGGEQ